jgi:RNA-binding protein
LQRIGLVLHVSSSKNMIIKAANLPKIGSDAVDENLKKIGKVFDVFGPVSSPYVAVQPIVKETRRLINHVIYTLPSPKLRRKRR